MAECGLGGMVVCHAVLQLKHDMILIKNCAAELCCAVCNFNINGV
jgi:hypothetical protein